jgi:adenine-specific DNA-methyltransferase
VPHVTLKSIANNPDIKEGMTREEIDAAIARHSDTEVLYDQPYEDKKRVRVTGPFTVESLSPHRTLPADDERPQSEEQAAQSDFAHDFAAMTIENLRKAGVQNTKRGERLKFDTLEPHAGRWIHATGSYTDNHDKTRRVAVSVGPEHGALSPLQIREAAKEAVEGIGYDLLVVCGYAFDPHVGEEAKKYGELTVLPTRMNADLSMSDELLKKTGAGNLFTVFGEPDIQVSREGENVIVTLCGLDVFDPTTAEIRSSKGTQDIACWFIDTDYNGESFFVRHAYFTGEGEPYDKLKKALRAEIDEDAWSSIYSDTSRPFPAPESGKIAVKVINHYGDEVLKVYEVRK